MADKELSREEIISLAGQMIMLQGTIEDEHLKRVFRVVNVEDYGLLKRVFTGVTKEHMTEPVYVKNLGPYLKVKSDRIARIIQHLQDRGYVYWEHDEEGTYVRLSESGLARMDEQQQIIDDFYINVINRMGYDKFNSLLSAMGEFTEAIKEEAEKE